MWDWEEILHHALLLHQVRSYTRLWPVVVTDALQGLQFIALQLVVSTQIARRTKHGVEVTDDAHLL